MRRVSALALLGLLAAAPAAAQESVFNLGAFGIPSTGEGLRGRGLGGAGLALDGPVFSVENPATPSRFEAAGIYLSVLGQRTEIEAAEGTGEFEDVVFPIGQVVIPAGSRWTLAVGYAQYLDFDARLASTIDFEGDSLPVTFDADGGLSTLSPSASYRLDDATALGLSLDVYLGSREVIRTIGLDQVDPGALETADTLARDFRAVGATVGLERRLGERIRVSAAYRLRPTITSEITHAPGEGLEGRETEIDLPDEVLVGAAVGISSRLLAAVALRRAAWGDFESEGVPPDRTGDALEVGGGLEWRPEARLWGLIGPEAPLRVGARWRRLPVELQGEPVTEWAATFGYGRRFGGRSAIDLALEVGSRGDLENHGLSESFVRVGVGLSTFEEWRRVD